MIRTRDTLHHMKYGWLLYLIAALILVLAGALGMAAHQRGLPILWYFLAAVFLVIAYAGNNRVSRLPSRQSKQPFQRRRRHPLHPEHPLPRDL